MSVSPEKIIQLILMHYALKITYQETGDLFTESWILGKENLLNIKLKHIFAARKFIHRRLVLFIP